MATMFLENLKASFSDFLRPNYYQVTFSGALFGERDFGLLCKGATFPFMTYNTTPVNYNNLPRHFVTSVDYDPITFEFLVDDGLKVLRFFDSWRKLIMNDGSRTFNYKKDYSGNIEVQLLNRKQFMRAQVNIIDAYPINIDNIALAADSNDQLISIAVSFRYDDVTYEFDEGFSIAGVRDTVFDLAQGTIGTGIDRIKDAIENGANLIPNDTVRGIFGGFGQQDSGFADGEAAIADRSKRIFANATGSGGASSSQLLTNAKKLAGGAYNIYKAKNAVSALGDTGKRTAARRAKSAALKKGSSFIKSGSKFFKGLGKSLFG